MGRLVRWSVLLSLALILPAGAQDEKKDAKGKADPKEMKKDGKEARKEKPEVKEKLVRVGTPIQGRMVRKPGAQPVIAFSIPTGRDKWSRPEELPISDELIVRVIQPPLNTDDKGRIKRYTKKELDELKGDKKLPGYTASLDDLKDGQLVEIHLFRKSPAPKNVKLVDLPKEYKPHVGMIIILGEPP